MPSRTLAPSEVFAFCPWCGGELKKDRTCRSCLVVWNGKKPTSLIPGRAPRPPTKKARPAPPAPTISVPATSPPAAAPPSAPASSPSDPPTSEVVPPIAPSTPTPSAPAAASNRSLIPLGLLPAFTLEEEDRAPRGGRARRDTSDSGMEAVESPFPPIPPTPPPTEPTKNLGAGSPPPAGERPQGATGASASSTGVIPSAWNSAGYTDASTSAGRIPPPAPQPFDPPSSRPPAALSPGSPPGAGGGTAPATASGGTAPMKITEFGHLSLSSVTECPMCGSPLPSSRVCTTCGIQWGEGRPASSP